MKKIVLLAASAAILSSTLISTAYANQEMSDRQKLIQEQMGLLAEAQNMMQLEIQSHFKRAQAIQSYQMCIQAASKKDDFRLCKMKVKKDQKMLDDEVASLRERNKIKFTFIRFLDTLSKNLFLCLSTRQTSVLITS